MGGSPCFAVLVGDVNSNALPVPEILSMTLGTLSEPGDQCLGGIRWEIGCYLGKIHGLGVICLIPVTVN